MFFDVSYELYSIKCQCKCALISFNLSYNAILIYSFSAILVMLRYLVTVRRDQEVPRCGNERINELKS